MALEVIIVILLKPAAESVLTKTPEAPQHVPAISGIKTANLFIFHISFASVSFQSMISDYITAERFCKSFKLLPSFVKRDIMYGSRPLVRLFLWKNKPRKQRYFMRSERQREIMAQLEAEKCAAKKNRGIVLFRIISILYVILAAAFVVLLWRMDVLPAKYLYGGIAVLVIA